MLLDLMFSLHKEVAISYLNLSTDWGPFKWILLIVSMVQFVRNLYVSRKERCLVEHYKPLFPPHNLLLLFVVISYDLFANWAIAFTVCHLTLLCALLHLFVGISDEFIFVFPILFHVNIQEGPNIIISFIISFPSVSTKTLFHFRRSIVATDPFCANFNVKKEIYGMNMSENLSNVCKSMIVSRF